MTIAGLGGFSFTALERPAALLLLLVPAALAVGYLATRRRRRQRILRYTAGGPLNSVRPRHPRWFRHLPAVVILAAMVPLTLAAAGPIHDERVARNRALIVLAIDVSPSMLATDVTPTRLDAAKAAARRFAERLTPGVNLGLIQFSGTAALLVPPSPDHRATVDALDKLRPGESTAIGAAVFAALQSVREVGDILAAGPDRPPARIVILSDGKETTPSSPDAPQGAFTSARAARDQGVPISTIAFGTDHGFIALDKASVPVPVDSTMLERVAALSGGHAYRAADGDQLDGIYRSLQDQIGYQTVPGPAGASWLRLAVLALTCAVVIALSVNRSALV